MEKEKIIVMIFKEKDAPRINTWTSIYKMEAEKLDKLDKDLVEWCDADIY